MLSSRWRFTVSLACAVALWPGCVCDGAPSRDPARETEAFGALSSQEIELAPYLALARAVVSRADRPAVPAAPGRRVFLTMFPRRAPRATTSGLGDSLERAVVAAGEALAKTADAGADAGDAQFRLELDVVTDVTPIAKGSWSPTWGELGLEGYALSAGRGSVGWILPSELLFDHRFESGKRPKLDDEKLLQAIRARVTTKSPDDERFYRFHVQAAVDTAAQDGALRVRRGMVDRSPGVSPAELVESVRAGADYLCRIMDDGGRYQYMVHALDGRADASYGMLRHCGTTFALMEAYDELKTPLYLEKGERALAYLKQRLQSVEAMSGERTSTILDSNDEEQQKVGGAGLALLAFTEHARATGKKDYLDVMRSLGRHILGQQYPDGRFRANRDLERDGKAPPGPPLKKELIYYVGEALFALMRLHAVDPDPKWLDAATKGADYCVDVRDATTTDETQEHDHWLSYALMELYKVTKKPSYAEHAFKIARAILLKQFGSEAPAPDFVGAFYAEAPSTPASTRLEAFGADIATARAAGKDDAWLVGPAQTMAKFIRAQQLDADAAYFSRDPAKVVGGVRESLFVYDIRIDYVQHAMSGWLHLARLLRERGAQ